MDRFPQYHSIQIRNIHHRYTITKKIQKIVRCELIHYEFSVQMRSAAKALLDIEELPIMKSSSQYILQAYEAGGGGAAGWLPGRPASFECVPWQDNS